MKVGKEAEELLEQSAEKRTLADEIKKKSENIK